MIIWQAEGIPDVATEDNGSALIAEISNGLTGDHETFVRVHSYTYKHASHGVFGELEGKRLRVTVELLD